MATRHGAEMITAGIVTVLDTCDSSAGWTAGGAAANLTTVADHVEGRAALSIDKVGGGTEASLFRVLKEPAVIDPERCTNAVVRGQVLLPDTADLVAVHLDLGGGPGDWSRFSEPAGAFRPGWNTLERLLRERNGGYLGKGLDTRRIAWSRVVFEFHDAGDILAGLLVDGIVLAEAVPAVREEAIPDTHWEFTEKFTTTQTDTEVCPAPGPGRRNRVGGFSFSAGAVVRVGIHDDAPTPKTVVADKPLTAYGHCNCPGCDARGGEDRRLLLDTDADAECSVVVWGDVVKA